MSESGFSTKQDNNIKINIKQVTAVIKFKSPPCLFLFLFQGLSVYLSGGSTSPYSGMS